MAIVTLPAGFQWPWVPNRSEAAALTPTQGMTNAANSKGATIVSVYKAGALRTIWIRTGTVTTGATLDIRVETVDGTTGDPTGTLWGTTTNASLVLNASDDNVWLSVTLTADATVAVGDVIAIVVVNPAVSFGNFALGLVSASPGGPRYPYRDQYNGSIWAKNNPAWALFAQYSDASFESAMGLDWVGFWTTRTIATNTTPNVRGNRITPAITLRASGAWVYGAFGGDYTVKIYGTDGVTVIATTPTMDKEIQGSTGNLMFVPFAAAVTLNAGSTYRLCLVPTTTTSCSLYDNTVATGMMAMLPGGTVIYGTSATSPTGLGDWTDTATIRASIGLLVNGIDDDATPPTPPTCHAHTFFGMG